MNRKRISKGKVMKPTFFVFCEGKTEELYVKYLKSKYRIPFEIDYKIAQNKISTKHINNYKKNKFTHNKDKTFLLYDIDAPKMLEKLQAIPDTILLASNPCIELWYLLHFKSQTSELDCKMSTKELTKRNKGYCKTELDTRLKSTLDKHQSQAISIAKKLKSFGNPSSTIYLLVEELEKIKI